jgi:hypothetical protein
MGAENARNVIYNPKKPAILFITATGECEGQQRLDHERVETTTHYRAGTRDPADPLNDPSPRHARAVIVPTIAIVPVFVSSLWFPENVMSLLTGLGSGMIVIIIPLIISEIKSEPHEYETH